MRRPPLFGLVIGLLFICVGGIAFASEIDGLRERAKAIRKEASVLADRGDKEQAERLERKAADLLEAAELIELKAKRRGENQDRPGTEVRPDIRAQIEQLKVAGNRIHHIRVAAENLKAAGVHDLAIKLMEQADTMEREVRAVDQRLAVEMREVRGRPADSLPDVVQDLRAEVERLRAEVKELRHRTENR